MKQTRLMSKLFSDETPMEFIEKVQEKIEEAKENGSSTLEEDGVKLQFAEADGDVIIEDQTDGAIEVTRAHDNEDDPDDIVLSAVEIPDETEKETEEPKEESEEPKEEEKPAEEPKDEPKEEEKPAEEPKEEPKEEVKAESDALPSVTINQITGMDGKEPADDIVPSLVIESEEEVPSEEGTFAFDFKNFSKAKAQKFVKIFTDVVCPCMKAIEQADVDEDINVKFEDEKMKVMSVTFGKKVKLFSEAKEEETDVTDMLDAASELAEACKDGVSKEDAEEVKEKAEKVLEMAEELEKQGVRVECIKSMCSRFSEEAAKVADEEKPEEKPEEKKEEVKEEEIKEEVKTESEVEEEKKEDAPSAEKLAEETPKAEPAEDKDGKGLIETKSESLNPQVIECDGKWCVEGDPEGRKFETQEEAEQLAAKAFSEPKATITIENLEAASVADLLKPAGANKIDDTEFKTDEVEPKVDPNEGAESGRRFSLTAKKESVNPFLTTEIN